MKIQIPKNFALYFLPIVMTAFVASLSRYYLKYGITFPMGWDAPSYVFWANELLRIGPLTYMIHVYDVHLYVQILAFLGFVFSNTRLAQAILPIIISLLYIYLYYKLTLNITHNSNVIALVTSVLASFGFQVANFLILPSQLLAYVFALYLILNLPWLDTMWSSPKNAKGVFLILVSILLASTHWPTYFFFGLSLFVLYVMTRKRKILIFGVISLVVSLSIQLLLSPFFLHPSYSYFPSPFLLPSRSEIQYLLVERLTPDIFFSYIGGNVFLSSIALVGLGVLVLYWKREKKNLTIAMLLLWSTATLGASFIVFPRRSLLLIPAPLLLAIGFGWIRDFLAAKKIRFSEMFSTAKSFVHKINFLLLFETALVSLLIITSVLVFFDRIERQRPLMSEATYKKVLLAKELLNDYAKEPIFAFYGKHASWFMSYYRGIIGMEIGRHYAYYGPLPYLIHGVSPSLLNFHLNPELERMQAEPYFQEIDEQGIEIASHPIVVIQDDFYGFSSALLYDFMVSDGIYLIPPNALNLELLNSWILTSYSDFYNLTDNTYFISKNEDPNGAEMITQYALEHYEDKNMSRFIASYLVILTTEYFYKVSVHLLDYSKGNAPLLFYLDENLVYTYFYKGTGNFTWVSFDLPIVDGLHILRIVVDDTEKPHAVTLDVIEVMPRND